MKLSKKFFRRLIKDSRKKKMMKIWIHKKMTKKTRMKGTVIMKVASSRGKLKI